MAADFFRYIPEISTNHLPTEIRRPSCQPRIIRLLESSQQNTATQHRGIKCTQPVQSSVRKLKHLYLQISKEIGRTTDIPHGNRGRPTNLGNCRFIYVNFISVNIALSFSASAPSTVSGSVLQKRKLFWCKIILTQICEH